MIRLIERQSVFDKYRNITEEISEIQRLFFDDDPEYFENEQDIIEYRELFDAIDIPLEKTKRLYSVISFEHKDIETFPQFLSHKLTGLLAELEIENLIMITHFKMSFIGNLRNKYRPLQIAFKKLENITKDIKYKEALELTVEDLAELIEIAFWIERCDANGPEYIFFHDKSEKLAFYLCKDGNVHIIEFQNEILSDKILSKYSWHFIEGRCYDQFSKDGKIEGRRSIV